MVSASIGTSPSFMRATTAKLVTGSRYNITCRLALPLFWQRHVCPEYEITSVGDANENLLQISSAAILCIQFVSAVYKATFLVADYIRVNVLIGTSFMNRHVNPTRCIHRQTKFTKCKVLLFGSAPNELTVKGLEMIEDVYS